MIGSSAIKLSQFVSLWRSVYGPIFYLCMKNGRTFSFG